MSAETSVSLAFYAGNKHFHAAFAGPSWCGAATFPGLSMAASATRVLSETGTFSEGSPPAFFLAGERLVVLHRGPRGIEIAPMEGQRRPELAFTEAAAFALAGGRRQSRLFAVDAQGLSTVRHDPKKGCSPSERWLVHAGKKPLLAAARAGEAEIAFIAWEGEPALYVVVEIDGKPRVVRHELPSECLGLSAFGAGNRAGVALAMADGDRIDVAIVDVRGVLVERFNTCLEGRGAAWRHPQVLWIEDAFYVLAVDARGGRTVLCRFDDGDPRADVTGTEGPFVATYYEKQLYIARGVLDERTDTARVMGHRLSLGGAAPRPFELDVKPPVELWEKRSHAHAERVIRATLSELDTARHGYRGEVMGPEEGSARPVPDDPHALHLEPSASSVGAATLGVRPCKVAHGEGDAVFGYDVTLLALHAGARDEPGPEGSFEKLARWVRERLSKAAWELALREQAWVEESARRLGGGGFWDRDENGLRLVVHVPHPPDPAVLAGWCKKVLADVAQRAWEKTQAPPT